jgi:hypothetical protein
MRTTGLAMPTAIVGADGPLDRVVPVLDVTE